MQLLYRRLRMIRLHRSLRTLCAGKATFHFGICWQVHPASIQKFIIQVHVDADHGVCLETKKYHSTNGWNWSWLCAIKNGRSNSGVCMSTVVHRIEFKNIEADKKITDLCEFRCVWFCGTKWWSSSKSWQWGQHSWYAHQTFTKKCFYQTSERNGRSCNL